MDLYKDSGSITKDVLEYAKKIVKPGIGLYEIAEVLEKRILDKGGKPAFPVNISIDDVAAHYTPYTGDKTIIKPGDVVKIDAGSHINGYISDSAITIEVEDNENSKLLEATEECLNNAISVVKAGISVCDIGEIIEKTATKYGFTPIEDLTGHSIQPYKLHAGMTIPNVASNKRDVRLQEGDVIAIEPFLTSGSGKIYADRRFYIFSLRSTRNVRTTLEKSLLDYIWKEYKYLPFAERWLTKVFGKKAQIGLNVLLTGGCIRKYEVLIEKTHKIVAQFEHTVRVTKDSCEVLTGG